MIEWFLENIEWIFSGIGCLALSFIFRRKSVQGNISFNDKSQKIIKGTGINNRTAENYYEDHSVNYNIKEIKRKIPDYTTYIALTIGASGCIYEFPYPGILCFKGFSGKVIINNVMEMALQPSGTLVDVETKDRIMIEYDKKSFAKKELLLFSKKDVVND